MKRIFIYIFLIVTLLSGCTGTASHDSSEIYSISEWEFYPNSWTVNPDNLYNIELPDKWPNDRMPSFGYGLYRASFQVPDGLKNLAIQMPTILSSYLILVNGDTLAVSGLPSTNRQAEQLQFNRTVIGIPQHLYEEQGIVNIMIPMSNFHYHVGGFLRHFVYGEQQVMESFYSRGLIINGLQSGAIALMSLFLLVYYFFRRKENYIFFFAILSLGFTLRLMLSENYIIAEFFPNMDGVLFLKLALTTFFLGIILNYSVLAGLFPGIIPHWSKRLVWIIGIICLGMVIFTPLNVGSFVTPFFQLFSVIVGVVLLYYTFQAALQHKSGAKTVLFGGLIAFIFMVNDILFSHQLINTGEQSGWGLVIYLFLVVVVIARRFSAAMENEEELLSQVIHVNNTLEERVAERTRKLDEYRRNMYEEAESIKASHAQLRKNFDEEQSMLKVMIHDLKAPFNKILGLAQIMRMNNQFKGKEEGELNEMILKVADEGRRLIEDLNVITMFETHVNDHSSFQVVKINELLEDSVKAHSSYAKSKNITINYHGHHKVTSFINPDMLSRIFDNLLSNAIKFSSLENEVFVELIRRTDTYEIVIKDQGPGFSDEDMVNIYGKFQKLSARPTQGESSTGLGLSIVKNLTDLMHGTIGLESSKNEGATFTLIFPIVRESTSFDAGQ